MTLCKSLFLAEWSKIWTVFWCLTLQNININTHVPIVFLDLTEVNVLTSQQFEIWIPQVGLWHV